MNIFCDSRQNCDFSQKLVLFQAPNFSGELHVQNQLRVMGKRQPFCVAYRYVVRCINSLKNRGFRLELRIFLKEQNFLQGLREI